MACKLISAEANSECSALFRMRESLLEILGRWGKTRGKKEGKKKSTKLMKAFSLFMHQFKQKLFEVHEVNALVPGIKS